MIEYDLIDTEARVLGCLIEKDMATPEYYPLSLNGLVNACNQKSNRNPVVSYDEQTILNALDGLRENQLAYQSAASRVVKYAHTLDKKHNLVPKELAIICLLLLRGQQTSGELRGRSDRLYGFRDLDELSETLNHLEEIGFIRKLERQPGHKEARYIHLLSPAPLDDRSEGSHNTSDSTIMIKRKDDRIDRLEQQVQELQEELESLKNEFLRFREEFE